MTRDDIIRMAREAGLYVGTNISGITLVGSSHTTGGLLVHLSVEEMQRFAALVSAHEREACARVCEELWETIPPHLDNGFDFAAAIRARESDK